VRRLGALCVGALAACAARQPVPPSATADPEPFTRVAVVAHKPYPDAYFHHFGVNPTVETRDSPVSTFAVDGDTASFALARSALSQGHLPERAAVRVEAFVNAFPPGGAAPGAEPLSVQVEGFPSPTRPGYHVLTLRLLAREVSAGERRPALVVLAVEPSDRVKQALPLILQALDERDQVALVTSARVVVAPTPGSEHARVASALQALEPGEPGDAETALERAQGLAAAAPAHLDRRILFFADGGRRPGGPRTERLVASVRAGAAEGVALCMVAFDLRQKDDALLERLARAGGCSFGYVDRPEQARRLLVEEASALLRQVARDVKVQVAFDPARVVRYRLLGYESRLLSRGAFDEDAVQTGALGAGQRVTALYEVKLQGEGPSPLGSLRIRYRVPEGDRVQQVQVPLAAAALHPTLEHASGEAQLSFLVAQFAEKLRGSYWVRHVAWTALLERHAALPEGVRARPEVRELQALIDRARALDTAPDRFARDLPVERMDFDHVPVVTR
jgi:Ca-activated chloride channel family protein